MMLFFNTLLLTINTLSSLLVSEYDCANNKNGTDFVKMERTKSLYIGGKSEVQGFKSSLAVKGKEAKTKFKETDEIVFFVKLNNNLQKNINIIKFNTVKNKRKAKSVEDIVRKDIEFVSIKIDNYDTENKIYKISLLKKLSSGNYCLCFISRNANGLGFQGMNKFVYDFDISK
jgi:hypothetical protein